MIARINTIPFLLWWTKPVEIEETDRGFMWEETQINIKATPKWVIFTFKHLPFLWLGLYVLFTGFFTNGFNPFAFTSAVVLVSAITGLYLYGNRPLQWFVSAVVVAGAYWLIFNSHAHFVHQTLGHTAKLSFVALALVDLYFLWKRDQYFFIENMEKEYTGTGSRIGVTKGRFSFPRFTKSRLQLFRFRVAGFFLKVQTGPKGANHAA